MNKGNAIIWVVCGFLFLVIIGIVLGIFRFNQRTHDCNQKGGYYQQFVGGGICVKDGLIIEQGK